MGGGARPLFPIVALAGGPLSKKAVDASAALPRFSSMVRCVPLYLVLREHGRTPGRERGDRWGGFGARRSSYRSLAEAVELSRKVARWTADHKEALAEAAPLLPPELDDRASNNWEPRRRASVEMSPFDSGRCNRAMDALKHDAPSGGYEVTRFTCHASRPGFRIVEMTLNPFSRCLGTITRTSKTPSTFWRENSVRPRRPHLVTNRGETEATFFVLQGVGEYDFVPLTRVS